jgi:hypothetical protein
VSLKIGNVLKAMDGGRWVKVPATSGVFELKVKQLLPGEQYALNAKIKELKDDDRAIAQVRQDAVVSHIVDWRDLLDANNDPLPFSIATLTDKKFLDAFLGLTVTGGNYLLFWIVSKINKSDVFAEDETDSFLAST